MPYPEQLGRLNIIAQFFDLILPEIYSILQIKREENKKSKTMGVNFDAMRLLI